MVTATAVRAAIAANMQYTFAAIALSPPNGTLVQHLAAPAASVAPASGVAICVAAPVVWVADRAPKLLRARLFPSIALQTRKADSVVLSVSHIPDGQGEAVKRQISEIAAEFGLADAVSVELPGGNHFAGSNRNIAARACPADTKLVAFADTDDIWSVHKLALVDRVFQDPSIKVLIHAYANVKNTGDTDITAKTMAQLVDVEEAFKGLVRDDKIKPCSDSTNTCVDYHIKHVIHSHPTVRKEVLDVIEYNAANGGRNEDGEFLQKAWRKYHDERKEPPGFAFSPLDLTIYM